MRREVREALRAAQATPLQCRMAWILFAINGAGNAIEFIARIMSSE